MSDDKVSISDDKLKSEYREKYALEFVYEANARGLIDISDRDANMQSRVGTSSLTKAAYRAEFYAGSLLLDVMAPYTAQALRHSLQDSPPSVDNANGSGPSNKMEGTNAHNAKISAFRAKLNTVSGNYYSESSSIEVKRTDDLDMYLAYHNMSYLMAAEKIGGLWKIYTRYFDLYNFEEWKYQDGLSSLPSNFVTLVNNFALGAQNEGAIVPYNIAVYTQN